MSPLLLIGRRVFRNAMKNCGFYLGVGILALLDVLALGWWIIIGGIDVATKMTSALLESQQREVGVFVGRCTHVCLFPSNSIPPRSKGSRAAGVRPKTIAWTKRMWGLSLRTPSYQNTYVVSLEDSGGGCDPPHVRARASICEQHGSQNPPNFQVTNRFPLLPTASYSSLVER